VSRRWDLVVVGGGPDGLACAALVARAGRRVLLLERRSTIGRSWITEEIAPGFRASTITATASALRPALVRALELDRHGLSLVPLRSTWAPSPEGPGVCRWADPARTREEIARIDVRDADRYPELVRAVARLANAIAPFTDGPPIDPGSRRPGPLARMGSLAHGLLRSGDLVPLLGIATQSVGDWVAEWLESEVLRAPIVAAGLQGAFLGPRSPGTALHLLLSSLGGLDPSGGGRCLAIGGSGAISDAMARSARAAGAEIRTGAAFERVRVEGDQATGVVLLGGEEIDAALVVLATEQQDGASARINLALDHLPVFSGRPGAEHLAGEITIAPTIDAMDESFVEARAGRWSRRPSVHVTIPTLSDPTLAPPGRHVMTMHVRYAPHALAGGSARWAEERDVFADHVLSVVEELCPGLTKAVVKRQVLTPLDLETIHGMAVQPVTPPAASGFWSCPPGGGARCAERLLAAGGA
jgi:phytoene dehydrogenase-like protein